MKGHHQDSENTPHRMRDNICKSYIDKGLIFIFLKLNKKRTHLEICKEKLTFSLREGIQMASNN
jgi:hypothetical protein